MVINLNNRKRTKYETSFIEFVDFDNHIELLDYFQAVLKLHHDFAYTFQEYLQFKSKLCERQARIRQGMCTVPGLLSYSPSTVGVTKRIGETKNLHPFELTSELR